MEHQCKNCGEEMVGDGYTSALFCPYAEDERHEYNEPDSVPVYCTDEDHAGKEITKLMWLYRHRAASKLTRADAARKLARLHGYCAACDKHSMEDVSSLPNWEQIVCFHCDREYLIQKEVI